MRIKEIESLSQAEKILLVEQIWDSIDKSTILTSKAQKEELDYRLKSYKEKPGELSSWEDVKARLKKSK